MFFCEKCRKKRNWPDSIGKSYGRCEVCGQSTLCNDVPSCALPTPPSPKPKPKIKPKPKPKPPEPDPEYDWEYCECGCHGHSLSVGGQHYWVHTALVYDKNGKCIGAGKLTLYPGHGPYRTPYGTFESYKDINKFLLPRAQKALEEAVQVFRILKLRVDKP